MTIKRVKGARETAGLIFEGRFGKSKKIIKIQDISKIVGRSCEDMFPTMG